MTAANSRFLRFDPWTDCLSAVVVLVLMFALPACTTYRVADAGSDATATEDAGPPRADGSTAIDSAADRPATIDSGCDGGAQGCGVDAPPPACLDGATRLCKDDPDLRALGNCGGGVELCGAGHWVVCSVVPASKDSCALIGDDATCNGKPNEGCPCVDGNQQPCGPAANVGICKRGTQTCAGGAWGACTGAIYSAARDCTSATDNDCDGMPDNTLDAVCVCAATTTRPCGEHAGQDGKGRCKAGTQTCVVATDRKTSAWGTCTGSVGPAAADTCAPGNDDNCNGSPNEGCTCVEGSTQACGPSAAVGICKKGSQTCSGAAWGACVGAVLPAARDCTSTLDNDCDGHPDNTIDAVCACASGATQACGQHPGQDGKGPCRAGSQTCVVAADKKSSAWGACSGSVGPAPADGCDATNDDNCNGILHEGCTCVNGTTRSCGPAAIGICKPGTQTCVNATWPTTCTAAVNAKARDCTSTLDNDCNGLPDNQEAACVCPAGTTGPCPGNNTGSCKSGTRTCILSADKTTTAWGTTCAGQVLPAAADTCDANNDANCDGNPNEGCQCINGPSPCPCGTQTCTNGKLGACVTTCAANQTCTAAGQCSAVPRVVAVFPPDGQTGVTSNVQIMITFSAAMNQNSVKLAYTSSTLLPGQVTFTWDSTGTILTIAPNSPLSYAAGTSPSITANSYSYQISAGAVSQAGVALAAPLSVGFSTLKRVTTSTLTTGVYEIAEEVGFTAFCSGIAGLTTVAIATPGRMVGPASVATQRMYVAFSIPQPPNGVNSVESATLSGQQQGQQGSTGDPYATSPLTADQIPYESPPTATDNTATPIRTLGVFASTSNVSQPSISVLPTMQEAFTASGHGVLLRFQFAVLPSMTAYANFSCTGWTINFTYLTP